MKILVACSLISAVLVASGCEGRADAPTQESTPTEQTTQAPTASEPAQGGEVAETKRPAPAVSGPSAEECRSLVTSAAKDAMVATQAACESSSSLPGALSGHECVRYKRYLACLKAHNTGQPRPGA